MPWPFIIQLSLRKLSFTIQRVLDGYGPLEKSLSLSMLEAKSNLLKRESNLQFYSMLNSMRLKPNMVVNYKTLKSIGHRSPPMKNLTVWGWNGMKKHKLISSALETILNSSWKNQKYFVSHAIVIFFEWESITWWWWSLFFWNLITII